MRKYIDAQIEIMHGKESIVKRFFKRIGKIMKKSKITSLVLVVSCLTIPSMGQAVYYESDHWHQSPPQYPKYYESHDQHGLAKTDIALLAAGALVVAATTYCASRFASWCLYKRVLSQYEPEFDLLARAYFNEAVIQEELIPYVLERHDRNNSIYFFLGNPYKNYPLLAYKDNLDWYINRLWVSKILYLDNEKISEITRLIEKLERIKRYIVTDYRFVQEQRAFDNRIR